MSAESQPMSQSGARLRVLAAALIFSIGGAGIKACHLTSWQVASFRSGIAAITLLLLLPEARRGWNGRSALVGLTVYVISSAVVAGGVAFGRTYLKPPLRCKLCRVDDASAMCGVRLAGTVAALAVNALPESAIRLRRVRVMAKETG